MINKERTSRLPQIAALLVFCGFALSLLLVLLSGAQLFERLSVRDRESFRQRTVCQYLTTRIRQSDQVGTVSVGDFAGLDALVLQEQVGNARYLTRIYCYDGALRELYTPAQGEFSPADGQVLLPAQALTLTLQDDTVLAQVTFPDGTAQPLLLTLRSEQGGLP